MAYRFETTCISAKGDDIREMVGQARQVTYATIRKAVGEPFRQLQYDLGYAFRKSPQHRLTMKGDHAVSYWKSKYKGKPCYYVVWSRIEHIFVQTNN